MNKLTIGRFCISVPVEMKQTNRYSKIRYADVSEIEWPSSIDTKDIRAIEWNKHVTRINMTESPPGTKSAIIQKVEEYSSLGRWAKGIFYYSNQYDTATGRWSMLVDSGRIGLLIAGDPTVVEKENKSHKMAHNIENIAVHYVPIHNINFNASDNLDNCFYLQHGVIQLPYSYQEESIVRLEGHPLNLSLLIEMHMDFVKKIETDSLISGTRAMLAASLFIPGGSMSKIRLQHREVAGMPGEESVLRIREGDSKDLVFTWRFNGKKNSGEYPTTRIEMESPDGNLDEKLQIWDAILDSMKPMFVRKTS